jgi:rhodanese-related sulfurtransferase
MKHDFGSLTSYALMAVCVVFILSRLIGTLTARRRIPELLRGGAQMIDVRSPDEYASGHAVGSRNIPLGDLERGAKTLDPNQWIIVCCASGTRSGIARRSLRRSGFTKVLNGVSWRNLP